MVRCERNDVVYEEVSEAGISRGPSEGKARDLEVDASCSPATKTGVATFSTGIG